jgi:sugar phosphate isomerase/epimerase
MDGSWREESTKIKPGDTEERIREVAREYLRRCYEVGLEVIAITDHNLSVTPDRSFIKWLWEENESVAREMGRDPLIIFPGFEIEADVGTGHHVICILPPDTLFFPT